MKLNSERINSVNYNLDYLNNASKDMVKMHLDNKKLKNLILQAKKQRKSEFNNFHSLSLRNSFQNNKINFSFVTELKNQKNLILEENSTSSIKDKNFEKFSQNDNNFFQTSLNLNNSKDLNNKFLYQVNDLFYENKSENYYKENPKKFIKSILLTAKHFYTLEIKREKSIQLKETYFNSLEKLKDNIFDLKKAESLLNNNFMEKQEKYLRYLLNQKDKENQELNRLKEKNLILDLENKNLFNKLIKQKNALHILQEYKCFLLNVKEKKIRQFQDILNEEYCKSVDVNNNLSNSISKKNLKLLKGKGFNYLKKFVKKTLEQSNENIKEETDIKESSTNNITINKQFTKKVTFNNLNTNDNKKTFKRNTFKYRSDAFKNNVNKDNVYVIKENKPIFENVLQLKEQFKVLEKENLALLDNYNKLKETKNIIYKDYIQLKQNEFLKTNSDLSSLKEIELKYEETIKKNEKLKKEKEKLIENKFNLNSLIKLKNKSINSLDQIKNNQIILHKKTISDYNLKSDKDNILFNKIELCYQTIQNFDKWKQIHSSQMLKKDISKTFLFFEDKNILKKLQEIETCILYLLNKKNEFKTKNLKLFSKIENILEKERKIIKTKEQRKQNDLKLKSLKNKINERCYKINFSTNKRKVFRRFKPKDKKAINYFENIVETDNFKDLLHFETCT